MSFFINTSTYNAAMYIRISKDDAERSESYSISNQRELIQSYVKSHPEINLCSERVDDGFSGVSFERPAIQGLFKDVKAGSINCVIVKDLSRFGRNYIETGRYIEQIFPFMGVRFIAINDNYDSATTKSGADSIIVPFKNLINDAYSRDISIKVRSQIEVRQKRGDYIGSFPVFGYMRSEDDKHRLVIDDYAADIVKKIFIWKKSGMNNQKIAEKLDEQSIPSPLEYKTLQNWTFSTTFKLKPQAKWSAVAVSRILKNEVYTGTMVQGKESTTNYKVKKRIKKSKEEWVRVENTHEAIISKEDFELVNKVMLADTRTKPNADELYIFSGLMRCDECGSNMIRKPVKSNGKEYYYYICSGNKHDKSVCSNTHRISERHLIQCTFEILKHHIAAVSKLNELLEYIKELPMEDSKVKKIDTMIMAIREKLKSYQKLKHSLYEDYKADILSKDDYLEMKKDYESLCIGLEKSLADLEHQSSDLLAKTNTHSEWVELFKKHENITELSRATIISLVDKIVIIDSKRMRIYFSYQSEFEMISQYSESIFTTNKNTSNLEHVGAGRPQGGLLAYATEVL